ncbi:autotransporter domain-containing protein [Sphingomonas sp. LY54]|uniref:autotransporter domain-containing protein n=1 Tax=Sphingomonas sp. LY54 TaxID=3095343 RepID=UPI002D79D236|nr:autotransporter domain-containing protein [Sphingomonas sp. LY54]WRP27618.1 autotransporter domain-containing protein [Sphingomonas sp. LY54]
MLANHKIKLLLTTAIAAGANVAAVSPLSAQSFGIHHTSSETLAVTNPAGDVIEGARIGIFAEAGPLALDNAGTVRGNGNYDGLNGPPEGGVTLSQGNSSIANSGTISGAGFGVTTAHYFNPATNQLEPHAVGTTVTNSGTIRGDSNDGVRLIGGGTVTNSGTIQGLRGGGADGISMFALTGQDTSARETIGTVTNGAEGAIAGQRFGILLSGGGVVANEGTISGNAGALIIQAVAGETGKTATVTNSGTLTGGDAVSIAGTIATASITNSGTIEGTGAYGIHNSATGTVTVTNDAGGVIEGAKSGIFGQEGPVVVNNAGTIIGRGTYDGFNAEPDSGIVFATEGSSVVNSGTIIGAGTGIGTANYYNAGTNSLQPRAVGTTVVNSGTITGQNNDAIRLIGGGTVTNSGTIQGLAGAGTDGISMFALQGQDTSGQGSIGTVTNATDGTISGPRFGVLLSGGGVIDNAGAMAGNAGAVIIQSVAGETGKTATITNSGTMTGGDAVSVAGTIASASIANSGTIEGTGAYGIHNSSTGTVTVTNEAGGVIEGAKSGIFGQEGPVVVTNAGTIIGHGTYDGLDAEPDSAIVFATERSSVVNSGTITGAGTGIGTANYYNAATNSLQPRAVGTTVVNSGTITGQNNDAIRLIGGGTVTNSGTIQGLAGAGTDGISVFALQGQDTSGAQILSTVTNEAGGTISGQRYGLALTGGANVENAGTISGNVGAVLIQAVDAGKTATLTNSGTLNGGVAILGQIAASDITNSGTVVTTANGAAGIRVSNGSATIANSGSITTSGSGSHGVLINGTGAVAITNAAIVTSGLDSYGINVATSAGDIAIDSESARATGNGQTYAIGAISNGGGDIVINSGTAIASGTENSRGIYALVNNGGDITINAGTTVGNTRAIYTFTGTGKTTIVSENATGNGGNAIVGQGASLSITSGIATGTANAAFSAATIFANADTDATIVADTTVAHGYGQYGIEANAVGTVDIISGTVTTDGDYGQGITVYAGGAVMVASGSITTDGLLSHGIVVDSGTSTAAIDIASATIVAAGEESDGIQIVSAGDVTIDTGSISATGYAIRSLAGGNLDVTISAGQAVSGDAGAILTAASIDLVRNAGHVTGAIELAAGDDTLENAGRIDGDAFLGAGSDRLVLLTGSTVNGVVDGGDGIDTVTLRGTSATATQAQTIAEVANFESLDVVQGYWTASHAVGAFNEVTIGANGILAVHELVTPAGSDSPIVTASIVNNGLLVLDFDNSETLTDFDGLTISGTGGVRLEGEGIFHVEGSDLTYTGTTTVANGGLVLIGTLGGGVTTSGDGTFTLGDGGTTGEFAGDLVNNGRFVFNRSDNYDFLGAFSGTGDFAKMGAGTLTFAGDYSYTGTTRILGGAVRFAGQIDPDTEVDLQSGSFDISGTSQTVAELAGASGTSVVIEDATLTVDQDSNSAYAGAITGDGSLVKDGDGRLNLTGASTYTGPTSVNGGTLSVNGSIVSDVTVNDGGRLGGTGTLADVVVASGGVFAPGNSIGTIDVVGNVAFAAGSIFEVEANAAGAADRINATGTATIANGARVSVLAEAGTYRPRTDYTILTAQAGVTGTFSTVTSNLAFLTPTLAYGANAVTLRLYRNDIAFADVAGSFNQASTGAAVQALGIGNPLFEDALIQSEAGAQAAFDALSGEIHASVQSALANDSRHIRDALFGATQTGEGLGLWGSAIGSWGEADARDSVAELATDHRGLMTGFTFGSANFVAGIAAGVSNADYDADARGSKADVDSQFLGVHLGYAAGPWSAKGGLAFGWHDVDTSRSVAFATINQTPEASYDVTTRQIFGEVSYGLDMGGFNLAPFARLAHVRTKTDGFAEAGGSAALSVDRAVQNVQFLNLGVHASGPGEATFQPRLSVSWQHGWGDLRGVSSAAFAGSSGDFLVVGSRLPRNAVAVDGGFDVDLGRVRIGASYVGSLSSDWTDHGAKANLTFKF